MEPKYAIGRLTAVILIALLTLLFLRSGVSRAAESGETHSELAGVEIDYYQRAADNGKIAGAFQKAGINFVPEISTDSRPSNVITCTPDVDPLAIQAVALVLQRGGAGIRYIVASRYPEKRQLVTVETYEGITEEDPPISESEIRRLTACPTSHAGYPLRSQLWAAAHDVGSTASFFMLTDPGQSGDPFHQGNKLRTNRPLNVRAGPADWTRVVGVLPTNSEVVVKATRWLPAGAELQQLWVQIDLPGSAARASHLVIARTPPSRAQVEACVKAGYQTVAELFVCSGGLFTPELLTSCLLGGNCELGASAFAFDGMIGAQGQQWSDPLRLSAPKLNKDNVIQCSGVAETSAYNNCIATKVLPQPDAPVSECETLTLDPDALGRCIVSKIPSPWNLVADCLMGSARNDAIVCFKPFAPDLAQQLEEVQRCLDKQGDEVNWQSTLCVVGKIPGDYSRIASCLDPDVFDDLSRKLQCASSIPFLHQAVQVVTCANGPKSIPALVGRCAPALGTQLPSQAIACLASAAGDQLSCLENQNIEKFVCYQKYSDHPQLSRIVSSRRQQ